MREVAGFEPTYTLDKIKKLSPQVEPLGSQQFAFYSVSCVWWTSFPEDIALHPHAKIPCCPYCMSPLMQWPLGQFLEAAAEAAKEGAYDRPGMAALVAAHHRNGLHGFAWTHIREQMEGGPEVIDQHIEAAQDRAAEVAAAVRFVDFPVSPNGESGVSGEEAREILGQAEEET